MFVLIRLSAYSAAMSRINENNIISNDTNDEALVR